MIQPVIYSTKSDLSGLLALPLSGHLSLDLSVGTKVDEQAVLISET
jgi:hypothetical protein